MANYIKPKKPLFHIMNILHKNTSPHPTPFPNVNPVIVYSKCDLVNCPTQLTYIAHCDLCICQYFITNPQRKYVRNIAGQLAMCDLTTLTHFGATCILSVL